MFWARAITGVDVKIYEESEIKKIFADVIEDVKDKLSADLKSEIQKDSTKDKTPAKGVWLELLKETEKRCGEEIQPSNRVDIARVVWADLQPKGLTQ